MDRFHPAPDTPGKHCQASIEAGLNDEQMRCPEVPHLRMKSIKDLFTASSSGDVSLLCNTEVHWGALYCLPLKGHITGASDPGCGGVGTGPPENFPRYVKGQTGQHTDA